MAITLAEARAMAADYGAMMRRRDPIILECLEAGMQVSDLARRSGVSRKTIYEISERAARAHARISADPEPPAQIREAGPLSVPFRAAVLPPWAPMYQDGGET